MATSTLNRPNFLWSNVGKVLKTASVYDGDSRAAAVSETGLDGFTHKIVKAGTIFVDATSGIKGLVFEDIDVTNATATKQVPASIMVAGHYINDASVLPAVVSASTALTLTVAEGQGLHAHPAYPAVNRPAFEDSIV